MAQNVLDLELKDLPGIGPATEKKLRDGGIESVLELATSTSEEVYDLIGGNKVTAVALILAAHKTLSESGLLEKEFVPASEALEWRRILKKCATGSQNLDGLLGGGIETQAITEFWGEYGSGKTQVCHTLCVTCQLPNDQRGLGGGALYIDTESTFRPERLYQIAEASGQDPNKILKNVIFCRVYNASHLELVVKSLGKFLERNNIKLVIVDSIISLHRAEFTGRGTLAERQQRLNSLIHRLLRIAEVYNIAVVVTNQVQSQPDVFFGDPTKPAGGHVIAHACTYRVYLKKAGQDRIAILVDSPYHPYSETRFTVTEKGATDPEQTPSKRVREA